MQIGTPVQQSGRGPFSCPFLCLFLYLFWLFWLFWTPGSAAALGKTAASPPHTALLQRGEAALAAGDLAAAEQALTAAYRQTPHADLLFQLGRLAAAQQQRLAAQDLMRRYLNDPTATADPDKTAEAQKVLAQPRPPSGKVRIQGDRGGFVLVDGRLLGRLPLVQPLLVTPGSRTVVIQYPGKLLDMPIEVVAGRMVDIQCTRATGAVFLATLPSLLVLLELPALSPAAGEPFLDAIERAAQGEQLTTLKQEALLPLDPLLKDLPAPKAQAELKRCLAQSECLLRLLRQTKLEYALKVHAKQTALPTTNKPPSGAPDRPADADGPRQWELSLELLHAEIFGAASTQTLVCSPCKEQQAIAALQAAVSKTLAVGLTRPHGLLAISSVPAGAEVRTGDQLLGRTPLSLAAWAGEYTLELRQPGHQPLRAAVRVESEKTAVLTATLPVIPPPPPAPPPVAALPLPPRWERSPRPRWRLVVGGSALFLGVALTAVGGLVFAINQGNNCPPLDSAAAPPLGCDADTLATQYNVGVGLMPVGGALFLTGVGLLAAPGPRHLVAAPVAAAGPDQVPGRAEAR